MLAAVAALLIERLRDQPGGRPRPPAPPSPPPKRRLPVTVRVDERIELFAIIFRLGGAEEYSKRFVPAYAKAIDDYFGRYRDHPAVLAVKGLRETRGVAYNAVADLAIQLGPLPELRERVPLEQSEMDRRWTPEAARDFIAKARDFAAVTNASAFFAQQRPLYAVAERRLRSLAEDEADLKWIQRFYGGTGKERFFIAPAPGNGQVAYGSRYFGPAGEREFYSVINVMEVDEDGFPAFHLGNANLLVHEFGHSYVTPLILEHYDTGFETRRRCAAGATSATRCGRRATAKARPSSMNRSSAPALPATSWHMSGEASAANELKLQRALGFVWIDDLYRLLGDYERDRARYPDIRAFYPVLRDYFQALPARLPAMKSALDASRPKIVETSPKNGAAKVDPATTKLVVRFDRPMRQSWGWRPPSGDMGAWPELSGVSLDDSRTVMTATIKLKPNTAYEATFLTEPVCIAERGFRCAPFTLKFTTRGRK